MDFRRKNGLGRTYAPNNLEWGLDTRNCGLQGRGSKEQPLEIGA